MTPEENAKDFVENVLGEKITEQQRSLIQGFILGTISKVREEEREKCAQIAEQKAISCSYCGKSGKWEDGWSYYGNLECKICQSARIDEVRCPECEDKK